MITVTTPGRHLGRPTVRLGKELLGSDVGGIAFLVRRKLFAACRIPRARDQAWPPATGAFLEASDGRKALQVEERHGGTIDLVITDMVMPRMSGSELARELCARRPDAKRLFTSGHTDGEAAQDGMLADGMNYFRKPFTLEALTRRVREILGAERGPA